MSAIVSYINSFFYDSEIKVSGDNSITPQKNDIKDNTISESTKVLYLVSANELLSVKLKPLKDVIPAPARNMPNINKFQLHMLNKAQLNAILSVKLKPINIQKSSKVYEPRHPVLKELLQKRSTLY